MILTARSQLDPKKIERYIHERRTCFVVAGAAHMGGPNGVIALLRARGYRVEEL